MLLVSSLYGIILPHGKLGFAGNYYEDNRLKNTTGM